MAPAAAIFPFKNSETGLKLLIDITANPENLAAEPDH